MPVNDLNRDSEYAHYLWHLHDAGVITLELADGGDLPRYEVTGSVWDDLYDDDVDPSLVAMIDNGCSSQHPYLPPVADAGGMVEGIDFATHDFGAIIRPLGAAGNAEDCTTDREGRRNHFNAANTADPQFWQRINDFDQATDISGVSDIIDALEKFAGVVRSVTTYAEDLPTHGTLLAGVVGARAPAMMPEECAEAIAYFGADPRCRLLPLNTSFRPEFIGLIHALLYAVGMGADVICIPRAIYKPTAKGNKIDPHRPKDKRASRIDTDPVVKEHAEVFESLLLEIAARVPVIIAAGNNGFKSEMVYPASLAGPDNALISVGAINGKRRLSSYTNTRNVTVYAPSDDAPVWTRRELRLDPKGRTMHDHVVTQAESEPEDAGDYSTWGVLSTDVPGAFGAEDGGVSTIEEMANSSPIMQRSQFASFGGTSAASGIVAGVVSLIQAKRRKEGQAPMTGTELKLHLQTNCPDLAVGPDGDTVKRIDADACLQAISTP